MHFSYLTLIFTTLFTPLLAQTLVDECIIDCTTSTPCLDKSANGTPIPPSTPPPGGANCICTEPYYTQIFTCMRNNCDSKLFSASQQFELGCNIVKDGGSSFVSSLYESLTSSLVGSLTASPTTSGTSENESVQTQSESAGVTTSSVTELVSTSTTGNAVTSTGLPFSSSAQSAGTSASPTATGTSGGISMITHSRLSIGSVVAVVFGIYMATL